MTSSRASTSWIASAGTPRNRPAKARLRISGQGAITIHRFLNGHPSRMAAFPDLTQSAAICTRASGRDSKIAAMTPMEDSSLRRTCSPFVEHHGVGGPPQGDREGRPRHGRPRAISRIFSFVQNEPLQKRLAHLAIRDQLFAISDILGIRFEDSGHFGFQSPRLRLRGRRSAPLPIGERARGRPRGPRRRLDRYQPFRFSLI